MYLEWMAITCAYLELKTTKQLIAHRQYVYRLHKTPSLQLLRIQTTAETGFRENRPVYSCVWLVVHFFLTVALIGCSQRRRKVSWPILSKTVFLELLVVANLVPQADLTCLLYVLFCSLCCPNERSSRSGASMHDTFSIWLRFETAFNLFNLS